MASVTYEGSLNVTKETAIEFFEEAQDIDDKVAEAVAERKDFRKRVKGAGINLKAFDRMRRDSQKSGEVREEEDLWYRRLMEWIGKPVGTQAAFDFPPPVNEQTVTAQGREAGFQGTPYHYNPWATNTEAHQWWLSGWQEGDRERNAATCNAEYDDRASRATQADEVTEHHAQQVTDAGYASGKLGKPRGSNPWTPSTYLWQCFDTGWERGAAERPEEPKRGRGRPPGSKNRPRGNGQGDHLDAE